MRKPSIFPTRTTPIVVEHPSPEFIPAHHMPQRQDDSPPFKKSILQVPSPRSLANSRSLGRRSSESLQEACKPIQEALIRSARSSASTSQASLATGSSGGSAFGSLEETNEFLRRGQSDESNASRTASPRSLPSPDYHHFNATNRIVNTQEHQNGAWIKPPVNLKEVAESQPRVKPPFRLWKPLPKTPNLRSVDILISSPERLPVNLAQSHPTIKKGATREF